MIDQDHTNAKVITDTIVIDILGHGTENTALYIHRHALYKETRGKMNTYVMVVLPS